MADCSICGKKLGIFNKSETEGVCIECYRDQYAAKKMEKFNKYKLERNTVQEAVEREIDQILLTTETAHNLNVVERIEIVTAEVAYGMNLFKDLFAGVRDIVGGRSRAVQQTMRDARRTAMYELKKEAYEVGANAVIGVDLDYVELSGAGSMVMLVASGTAVRIES